MGRGGGGGVRGTVAGAMAGASRGSGRGRGRGCAKGSAGAAAGQGSGWPPGRRGGAPPRALRVPSGVGPRHCPKAQGAGNVHPTWHGPPYAIGCGLTDTSDMIVLPSCLGHSVCLEVPPGVA